MLISRRSPKHDADVRKLQEGLAFFGFHPGSADGIFGKQTEDAVEDWQTAAGLYADGLFGRASATRWNEWCDKRDAPQFKFVSAAPAEITANGPRLTWTKCPATPMPNGHGFQSLTLRSDAAAAYMKIHEVVTDLGGYITTAGGRRGLSSKSSPSRSKKSFHYTGRAFDLATYSGLNQPDSDPFLCVRDPNNPRLWQVWYKASRAPEVTLEVTVCAHKKTASGKKYTQLSTRSWTGNALCFTDLAAEHGFVPIQGRRSFFQGGNYMGAEWWHFQWVTGLTKGESTFGGELLRVYSPEECERFVYWNEAKDAVFGVNWF